MEQEKKEKYLSIKLAGHNTVYAFLNKDRESGTSQPHFKSDGVAVWINEKKPKPKVLDVIEELALKME